MSDVQQLEVNSTASTETARRAAHRTLAFDVRVVAAWAVEIAWNDETRTSPLRLLRVGIVCWCGGVPIGRGNAAPGVLVMIVAVAVLLWLLVMVFLLPESRTKSGWEASWVRTLSHAGSSPVSRACRCVVANIVSTQLVPS